MESLLWHYKFVISLSIFGRIQTHVSEGKKDRIWPGVDFGLCQELKLQNMRKSLLKVRNSLAGVLWIEIYAISGHSIYYTIYFSIPLVLLEQDIPPQRRPPNIPITNWGTFPSVRIPQYFNLGQAIHYLVERAPKYDEAAPTGKTGPVQSHIGDRIMRRNFFGITNPFHRGEQYVSSNSVLRTEDTVFKNHYFIRAKVQASYEANVHIVIISISNESGSICDAICNSCKQRSLGRCCHVSAVLLLVGEHIRDNGNEGEEIFNTTFFPKIYYSTAHDKSMKNIVLQVGNENGRVLL